MRFMRIWIYENQADLDSFGGLEKEEGTCFFWIFLCSASTTLAVVLCPRSTFGSLPEFFPPSQNQLQRYYHWRSSTFLRDLSPSFVGTPEHLSTSTVWQTPRIIYLVPPSTFYVSIPQLLLLFSPPERTEYIL